MTVVNINLLSNFDRDGVILKLTLETCEYISNKFLIAHRNSLNIRSIFSLFICLPTRTIE